MIQCRICGGQSDPAARFCVKCGTALAARPPAGSIPTPDRGASKVGSQPRMTMQPPKPGSGQLQVGHPPVSTTTAFAQTAAATQSLAPRIAQSSTPSWDPSTIPENAPSALVGFLISYEINPLGQYWPIHQGQNLVGRQGSGLPLAIEIGHPTTSSKHALLYAVTSPNRVLFEDVGSTNGSFVNNNYLPPGLKKELHDGDTIRLGLFSAVVKLV